MNCVATFIDNSFRLEVFLMVSNVRTHIVFFLPDQVDNQRENIYQQEFSVILSNSLMSIGARVKTRPYIDVMSNIK